MFQTDTTHTTPGQEGPRPSADGLLEFCRGGFPRFRWDLLGFAFARTWLSYCLFFAQIDVGTELLGLPGDSVLLLSGSVIILLLLLAARLTHLDAWSRRGLCVAAVAFGAVGAALLWAAAAPGLPGAWLTVASLPFLGASAGLIQTLWCTQYATLPLSSATLYSLYSMLLAAVLTVFTNPHLYGIQASTFVFVPAFALVLLYSRSGGCPYGVPACPAARADVPDGRSTPVTADTPAGVAMNRNVVKVLSLIILARFLYALIYNFIITALAWTRGTSDVQSYASTTFAILIVLAVYYVRRERFDPAPLYRMVLPIAVIGFAVVYLFFDTSASMGVSVSVLGIGYKIFDLMYWLMLFKVAKLVSDRVTSVMAVGVCATYLGMGLGRAVTELTRPLWFEGNMLATFVIVGCCILVIASVVVLPERVVSSLWSSGREGRPVQEAFVADKPAGPVAVPDLPGTSQTDGVPQTAASSDQGSFDAALSAVASRFGLSERESEVFALLASGRSQPYIASELCIARGTVHAHVARIYAKLGVSSQDELIDVIMDEVRADRTR